jgi:hypothetical protein
VGGLRAAGYRVWTVVREDRSGGAVLYARGKAKPRVLLVLKASVTLPPRRHYLLTRADQREIARLVARWLGGGEL